MYLINGIMRHGINIANRKPISNTLMRDLNVFFSFPMVYLDSTAFHSNITVLSLGYLTVYLTFMLRVSEGIRVKRHDSLPVSLSI